MSSDYIKTILPCPICGKTPNVKSVWLSEHIRRTTIFCPSKKQLFKKSKLHFSIDGIVLTRNNYSVDCDDIGNAIVSWNNLVTKYIKEEENEE